MTVIIRYYHLPLMKTDWSSLEEGSSAADEAIKVETARNELSKVIEKAKAVSNTDGTYTSESFKALKKAIADAEALSKNSSTTADKLEAAGKE